MKKCILKRYPDKLILIFFLAFVISLAFVAGQGTSDKTFYVATTGSDSYTGTISQPFASLNAAIEAARKAGSGEHRIIIMPGEYFITEVIELDTRDNGLTIEADQSGKVIFYGGFAVTEWKRDGDKFWSADLPGVKEGLLDFRSIIVNGKMPDRARMPESGTLTHLSVFDAPWLSTVGGGWARKPTEEEMTTMKYDPKDIPESLDINNAEVRVYHMWNTSTMSISRNDIQNHVLIFTSQTSYPPGGFGKNEYIIFNTREGMLRPGNWYLDRTNGRIVYWPLPEENILSSKIIIPKTDRIFRIIGKPQNKVENISIKGLILQGTNIPSGSSAVRSGSYDGGGTISLIHANNCILEGIEITNIFGQAISGSQLNDCKITDCHLYNLGGSGVRFDGNNVFFARNHIHDVGKFNPNSIGIATNGTNHHIYRNELHDIPYSGMNIYRTNILVEENLIYRVMREIQDGAAIYAVGNQITLRGNVARDIVPTGTGYGVSSYYFDEGSFDNIVENNISIGVAMPTHNHISQNSIIRNNVFIADRDMTISFRSSSGYKFENNTLILSGRIRMVSPNAVISWKGNKILYSAKDPDDQIIYKIDSVMPYTEPPRRKTNPIMVSKINKAPVIDGILSADEWPGNYLYLDRTISGFPYSGAPVMAKFTTDNKFFYVGVLIAMFNIDNASLGETWKKDDGIEIAISGFDKDKPCTFVLRAYLNGTVQSVTDAGTSAAAAGRLRKGVKYAAKPIENPRAGSSGWMAEWAIPLSLMGLKAESGTRAPFNISVFVNEYEKWHCWEGTQGETWEVDKAGFIEFR